MKFHFDVVDIVFGVVKQQEFLGIEGGDLAAEFGADGTAGAGDEDDFVFEVTGDFVQVDVYFFSAEQVFDLDGADLTDGDFAVDQFVDAGEGFNFDRQFAADAGKAANLGTGRGWNGDDDFINFVLFHDVRDVVAGAEYFDTVEGAALLGRIVVDEADGDAAAVVVFLHFGGYHGSCFPGADNEYAGGMFCYFMTDNSDGQEADKKAHTAD